MAHRADLLRILQQALPAEQLRLGHRCSAVQQSDDGVTLTFTRRDGSETVERADAAIGADGIHSVLRESIAPAVDARFSGLCAFRCLVPATQAPAMALRPVQSLWLGAQRHFVHYPISGGRLVNLVAIVPAGDWREESWTSEGRVPDLRAEFEGWDARVLQLIDAATDTRRWALVDRTPLPRWTDGRLTLLGDAAHAMLPFFAQGAAQAVEDAEALALCLRAADRTTVTQALMRYDAHTPSARQPGAGDEPGPGTAQPPARWSRAGAARCRARARRPAAAERLAVRPRHRPRKRQHDTLVRLSREFWTPLHERTILTAAGQLETERCARGPWTPTTSVSRTTSTSRCCTARPRSTAS